MAPVFFRVDEEVNEVQGVPTELNARLLAGELDLAPVSSIEYARNAERLRLLPRLCVVSERYVYRAGFLARCFENLRDRIGPRERAGLMTFLELARDVGELDEVPELRFVREAVAVWPTRTATSGGRPKPCPQTLRRFST